MRRSRIFLLTLTVLACAVLATSSFAGPVGTRIYTSGTQDGMAGRDWWSGSYSWVDATSSTVQAYHDGGSRWLYRGIVIFDISPLAGQTLLPNSTTFNFYSFGMSGVSLQYFTGDPGAAVAPGHNGAGGPEIANLDGTGEGWRSYDVTDIVGTALQNGQARTGFIFNAFVNYGSGTIAASEDSLGRGSYLQTVPEPGSLLSLATGVIGLVGFGLRRKRR